MNDLNPRQMKFCDNTEQGMSLVQAYIQAGYKDSDAAYSSASDLLRNPKILAEMDNRLFARKRSAQQRFGSMIDGSTNVYINILKRDAGDNMQLLALQQRVASDVFNRMGLKPKDAVEHSGQFGVTLLDVIRERRKQAESEA